MAMRLGFIGMIGCTGPQAVTDQGSEQFIRSHPEVIEQSPHAQEAKPEAEVRAWRKAALADRQQDLLNDPTSPVIGNPSYEITLIEFCDYRRGFCKRAASAVTQLPKDDPLGGIVYKDFPIPGEASELATKAAWANHADSRIYCMAGHESLVDFILVLQQIKRTFAEPIVDQGRLTD